MILGYVSVPYGASKEGLPRRPGALPRREHQAAPGSVRGGVEDVGRPAESPATWR